MCAYNRHNRNSKYKFLEGTLGAKVTKEKQVFEWNLNIKLFNKYLFCSREVEWTGWESATIEGFWEIAFSVDEQTLFPSFSCLLILL